MGRPLWKKLWRCFEGGTELNSKALAEKFFGTDHARKMCLLTERQVRRRLSCYLPRAVEYASDQFFEPAEASKFIRNLVSGLYVIFDSKQRGEPEDYDENYEGLSVSTFPAGVLYNDWYERSVGSSFFTCSTSLLMKSTGEDFGARELQWLKYSIQDNIDANGPEELYGFECEHLAANKIWVKINELDRETYVDGVMGQVNELSERQLHLLLERMVDWLVEAEEELAPHASTQRKVHLCGGEQVLAAGARLALMSQLFGNVHKLPREAILGKIERMLLSKKRDDRTVRELENIANRMLGAGLRDYHCQVY
jgi:hypothetical protein